MVIAKATILITSKYKASYCMVFSYHSQNNFWTARGATTNGGFVWYIYVWITVDIISNIFLSTMQTWLSAWCLILHYGYSIFTFDVTLLVMLQPQEMDFLTKVKIAHCARLYQDGITHWIKMLNWVMHIKPWLNLVIHWTSKIINNFACAMYYNMYDTS